MYGAVALGGALGSVARAWLGGVIGGALGTGFPWGTLAINVLGSFVIGWFAVATDDGARLEATTNWRVFVMVGGVRRLHHIFCIQPADPGAGARGRTGAGRGLCGGVRGPVFGGGLGGGGVRPGRVIRDTLCHQAIPGHDAVYSELGVHGQWSIR